MTLHRALRRRRRYGWVSCVALALLAGCRDRQPPRPPPAQAISGRGMAAMPAARLDLASWLRMRPSDFGCWMERSFSYRDPVWNCSAPERPVISDPCQEGFNAGPAVPPQVARSLHPLLRGVDLAWEHGALRRARFRFDPGVADADLPRMLGIGPRTLESAASSGPGACETPCYEVVVFAASEEQCEDDEDEDG